MLDIATPISALMPGMPEEAISQDMRKRTREFDKALGSRVKFMRKLRGISQERLAHDLGLTFQQVQKYESGANRFPVARLVHTARLLGCTAAFLIGETHSEGPVQDFLPELADRPDIVTIIPELTKASAAQVKALKKFLESITD